MELKEIFKDIIKETVKPIFKATGYRKKSLDFYKHDGDFIYVVNFQKSKWNHASENSFYVNVGVHSKIVDELINEQFWEDKAKFPKEYQCHYRDRIANYRLSFDADLDQIKKELQEKLESSLALFDEITNSHKVFIHYLCKEGVADDDTLRYCLRTGLEQETNLLLDCKKERFQYESRWTERIKPYLKSIMEEEQVDFATPALEGEEDPILDPEDLELIDHFGKIALEYYEEGSYQEAIDEYRKCFDLIPTPQGIYEPTAAIAFKLADAHWKLDQVLEAKRYIQYALFDHEGKKQAKAQQLYDLIMGATT